MSSMSKKLDFPNLIFLIVALFTIFLQIYPIRTAKDQKYTLILFIAILVFGGITYFTDWISDKFKAYTEKTNQNTLDLIELKEQMSLEKKFADIDKRLSIIEKLSKKGASNIDPRWIFMIILLILFYLYLKSLDILP